MLPSKNFGVNNWEKPRYSQIEVISLMIGQLRRELVAHRIQTRVKWDNRCHTPIKGVTKFFAKLKKHGRVLSFMQGKKRPQDRSTISAQGKNTVR